MYQKNLCLVAFALLLAILSKDLSAQPQDLEQLESNWLAVNKGEKWSELLSLESVTVEDSTNFFTEEIVRQLSEASLGEISKFSYEFSNKEIRKTIMSNLFINNTQVPRFCSAIEVVADKLNQIAEEDPEAKKELQKKALSICKKQTQELLNGIFYTNTNTYSFLNIRPQQSSEASECTVYIASLVEPDNYLKYTFKL